MPAPQSERPPTRLRALVVDDEPLARDELAYLLEASGQVEVVGQAESGAEALALAAHLQPDLAFLDVQMPGMDGFAVAEALLAAPGPVPRVIFCTAYDQFALRAFEVHAVDYLLKPVDPSRLHRALRNVQGRLVEAALPAEARLAEFLARLEGDRRPVRIPVEGDGRIRLIDPREVLCASAAEDGTTLCTARQEFRCSQTLQDLENRLAGLGFARVHRQHLVNLEHVREYVPWFSGTAMVVVGEGRHRREVPVARSQVKRVRELLGLE